MNKFGSSLVTFLLLINTLYLVGQVQKIAVAEVHFEFVSKGVKGTLSGFSSSSEIHPRQIEKSIFRGQVESKTLDTNNGLRNWSLRGRKYFNVDEFPYISFHSTEVNMETNAILVKGMLTIKEVTKPVLITFNRNGKELNGSFDINSMDYGIKIKKNRGDNLVKVRLKLELHE